MNSFHLGYQFETILGPCVITSLTTELRLDKIGINWRAICMPLGWIIYFTTTEQAIIYHEDSMFPWVTIPIYTLLNS